MVIPATDLEVDLTFLAYVSPLDLGGRLFSTLFKQETSDYLYHSLNAASQQDATLRINLHLNAVPELATLPWEYLYSPDLGFLGLSRKISLVRYLDLPQPVPKIDLKPPLNVLVVLSNPTDLGSTLDVDAEWTQIQIALQAQVDQGLIRLDRLDEATTENLQQRLRQDDVHILHFVGHGYTDEVSGTGNLILEKPDGTAHRIDQEQARVLLGDCESLRLVFLNACDGAAAVGNDVFTGIAQNLVRVEIPAVIGMASAVSDQRAVQLAKAFYTALGEGLPIDRALTEARKAIFLDGSDPSWGAPILFSRAEDLRLITRDIEPMGIQDTPPETATEDSNTLEPEVTEAGPNQSSNIGHEWSEPIHILLTLMISFFTNIVSGIWAPTSTLQWGATIAILLSFVLLDMWWFRDWWHGDKSDAMAAKMLAFLGGQRRIGFAATGLLIFLSIGIMAQTLRTPPSLCRGTSPCVLIATLYTSSEQATDRAEEISSKLESDIRAILPDGFQVYRTEAVSNSDLAGALAQKNEALLVVWGQLLQYEDRIEVHFELVDILGIAGATTIRPYRAEPVGYAPINQTCTESLTCFSFDGVTLQTNVVAHATTGLMYYASDYPEKAVPQFAAALYCSGEEDVKGLVDTNQLNCTPAIKSLNRDTYLLQYYLGKALIQEGNFADGLRWLGQVKQAHGDDPAVWIGIATGYNRWIGGESPTLAVEALLTAQSIIEAQGTSPSTYLAISFDLGLIAELLGGITEEKAYLEEALVHFQDVADWLGEDEPEAFTATMAIARVQALMGNHKEAKATLLKARSLGPTSIWPYLELAKLEQDSPDMAITHLNHAKALVGSQPDVEIINGQLCQTWDDRVCALNAFNRAEEQRPDSGRILSIIGEYHSAQSNWEAAETYYRRALASSSGDPWSHQRYAYVLYQLQKYALAAAQINAAIDIAYNEQSVAGLFCDLGTIQRQLGQNANAIDSYKMCITHTTDPLVHEFANLALEELREIDSN